jgi:arsenate reductase
MSKQRVLFICTHNSARSQMAEAFLRHVAGDRYEVASAGTEATAVRPEAIAVMAEIGVDISSQTSKTLDRYRGEPWDFVITVCDDANETCPVFPGATTRSHWNCPDPSKTMGSAAERLAVFRKVRDQIVRRVRNLDAGDDGHPEDAPRHRSAGAKG